MVDFDPSLFGITMGQLTGQYRTEYSWLSPLLHIVTLALIFLVFRYGQRFQKAFTVYFILNYVWLVVFVGGWFSLQLFQRLGIPSLAMYAATPVLLLVILYQWIQEYRKPQLDLDFSSFEKWRLLIVVPFFIWGFWYPPYTWGVGLNFDPKELLFGAYGLMGCPTTMIPLALLFLKYPKTNRPLFYALTVYALFIGAAMVALQYVPDIPFFFIGVASLGLIIGAKIKGKSKLRKTKAEFTESGTYTFALPSKSMTVNHVHVNFWGKQGQYK
ncbi:MAG: hypothetical protein NWE93_09175 [Candidatus Bathyarchaeota archaeon]|nr:hypothetical protein [Candidatus Bathyarchaeota archaeon]